MGAVGGIVVDVAVVAAVVANLPVVVLCRWSFLERKPNLCEIWLGASPHLLRQGAAVFVSEGKPNFQCKIRLGASVCVLSQPGAALFW